jgi:hypothetical protein
MQIRTIQAFAYPAISSVLAIPRGTELDIPSDTAREWIEAGLAIPAVTRVVETATRDASRIERRKTRKHAN